MRTGTFLALVIGSLWLFPSCGGGDATDGGDDDAASDSPKDQKGDSVTSNTIDSAAE